ncbi:unnamed protein product [Brachionus calyciflorus]|uniref:Uncharacterized protein n=1 Tax=Brachionus calyciflorus TaxID=104777 RepID=A0A813N1U0_9BILA|nr:unnamed protein product [Brachionus calyciflorus]
MDSPNYDYTDHVKKLKRAKRKRARKPHARTGLITTGAYLVDKIINKRHEEYDENKSESHHLDASFEVLNSKVETSEGLFDVGKSISASANLAEAKAGNEDIGLRTSILSANAHAEYGLNNSIGVNASLVRAEGHFGPVTVGTGLNLDCSASIGVNGIEASLLGTGVSLGPKIAIKTPFADLKINLF